MDFSEQDVPTAAPSYKGQIDTKRFLIGVGLLFLVVGVGFQFMHSPEGWLLQAVLGVVFIPSGVFFTVAGLRLSPFPGNLALTATLEMPPNHERLN